MSVISDTYGKLVARVRAFRAEQMAKGRYIGETYAITSDEYVAAVADMAATRGRMKHSGPYYDRFVCAYEAYKMTGDFRSLYRELGDVSLFGVQLRIEETEDIGV